MVHDKQKRKKRILYVENGIGYGGAIICLRHLVRNLDRSKYETCVVTSRTGPDYRQIASETTWKYINDRYIDFRKQKEFIEKNSIIGKIPGLKSLITQILARLDDFFNFLPFFIRVLKLTYLFKPDLIHVNNEPLCNRAAIFAGKIMKIPIVCHVRAIVSHERGKQKGLAMLKYLYNLPDHFVPVSHWVSESIGKLGVPEAKRTVIYDGITFNNIDFNADGSVFREKFNIGTDDFAVGLVGMLIPWKGQGIFLDAAKILKDKIPNLRMMIIGGTTTEFRQYEADLKKRVKEEQLDDIVNFTGHQTKMDEIYNGLDIAVSASTAPEPLGTMVIETMVMGRPLIAPAHGGGAEMTDHKKTGLLFQPGDAQDFADTVLVYYDNPDLRVSLGQAAKKKALQTFSVEMHVGNIQSVYENVFETVGS